ncbi:glycosyltransferase family 4 protein [Salinibacillus xinjiangensis]|uniref:Undecaprenyl/decaprenyl-phosphate alpha-N-acetylglucosaminyl 1-phosphate transferase n=1 Tax=Salinibacillus xinjiangensis TaxID=1229268 RepID=A0A6G1X2J7_9BACI|nr:MraY family glycosyltransferase [Salinibacillus xinjiangensis]MRG85048.1 undecaprenyl/decaprenyl-phosphate alpha-N-acetylglucosaminyl 1-phosphate transferase [Salinibacillus xinjiangensis]
MEYLSIITCFLFSISITPIVKKVALKINAVDVPEQRKVHDKIMPRLGGLAIYTSFVIGLLFLSPDSQYLLTIITGATVIMLVGVLDDVIGLSASMKLSGHIVAALIVVLSGLQIEFITIPFGPKVDFEIWGIPITILWIVGVTNAINLIDGLDGLAAGIAAIALITISGMALFMGNVVVAILGLMLLGSTLGFLIYNFYPAKIFLGDTGSYFLGFMISVLSILGLYKNVTVFSLIVPIIILGVPIVDTFFAIVRRFIQGKPLHSPDKAHLHHSLIKLGFTHRQTVLILYTMSGIFSLAAIVFTRGTMWGSTIVMILLAILIELTVEITGLVSHNYRPVLNLIGIKNKQ